MAYQLTWNEPNLEAWLEKNTPISYKSYLWGTCRQCESSDSFVLFNNNRWPLCADDAAAHKTLGLINEAIRSRLYKKPIYNRHIREQFHSYLAAKELISGTGNSNETITYLNEIRIPRKTVQLLLLDEVAQANIILAAESLKSIDRYNFNIKSSLKRAFIDPRLGAHGSIYFFARDRANNFAPYRIGAKQLPRKIATCNFTNENSAWELIFTYQSFAFLRQMKLAADLATRLTNIANDLSLGEVGAMARIEVNLQRDKKHIRLAANEATAQRLIAAGRNPSIPCPLSLAVSAPEAFLGKTQRFAHSPRFCA